MKTTISILCIMIMFAALAGAQSMTGAASADPSPAAQSMAAANETIRNNPKEYTGFNLLAAALVRRAQETSDVSFYKQADDAVKQSLKIAPNNFETEKIRVSILLGEHEYPNALEAAKALNK